MLEEILKVLVGIGSRGKPVETAYVEIPGIVTGAAYASGDAFGTIFSIPVPKSGFIEDITMLDLDDEGIQTDFWFFNVPFTATADNSEFDVSDSDLSNLERVICVTNFSNAKSNQVGINNGLGLSYKAPKGYLYCQCVIRGAANIAAGHIPKVKLGIRS